MGTKAEDWDERVDGWVSQLPDRARATVDWLREPSRSLIRVGAALLFIIGGLLSILPVLGLWMLPVGLALLSQDLQVIKAPLERAACWIEDSWTSLTARWRR